MLGTGLNSHLTLIPTRLLLLMTLWLLLVLACLTWFTLIPRTLVSSLSSSSRNQLLPKLANHSLKTTCRLQMMTYLRSLQMLRWVSLPSATLQRKTTLFMSLLPKVSRSHSLLTKITMSNGISSITEVNIICTISRSITIIRISSASSLITMRVTTRLCKNGNLSSRLLQLSAIRIVIWTNIVLSVIMKTTSGTFSFLLFLIQLVCMLMHQVLNHTCWSITPSLKSTLCCFHRVLIALVTFQ